MILQNKKKTEVLKWRKRGKINYENALNV